MTSTVRINGVNVPKKVLRRSKREALAMAGVDPRPSPPWVQEAARLRAEGHSLRGIVYLLNGMGFGVACHNSIRYWLEPEFRERKNAIAREFWAKNHPKTRWRRR